MSDLRITEAAELLRVSDATVRRWADEGLLPHYRLPSGERRFEAADVVRFSRDLREQRECAPTR